LAVTQSVVKFMPTRLIDYLKARGITMLRTSLMDSEEDGQVAKKSPHRRIPGSGGG
jgi:maleate cis-trans isomerase